MEPEAFDAGTPERRVPVAIQSVEVAAFWSREDVTVQMAEGAIFQRDNSALRLRERLESAPGRLVHDDMLILA